MHSIDIRNLWLLYCHYETGNCRFALVDLGSSHGTFVGTTRIQPLTVIFLEVSGYGRHVDTVGGDWIR